jgi:release factor glutamine methyltransferase
MATIAESLETAGAALTAAEIPDARLEASSLLRFATGKDRAFLIAHPEYELNSLEAETFRSAINRRATREPFHYIAGIKEFYGLEFVVTPDVLIPRPETEMLAAKCIEILENRESPAFCEIGVGSGCIAVSILYNIAAARAVGLDISTAALDIARRNAERNGVTERLKLLRSDIFDGLDASLFDLIVSNPPYIPAGDLDTLQPEVKDFEPRMALTDGGSGLAVLEDIIADAPKFLRSGGSLVLEIGIGQADAVRAMFDHETWADVHIFPDFHDIPRMVLAEIL